MILTAQDISQEWIPTPEEVQMMNLVCDLGRTYKDDYLAARHTELGFALSDLLHTVSKIGHYPLYQNEKGNFESLKKMMSKKISQVTNPKFKPGSLVSVAGFGVGLVVSSPYVWTFAKAIVVDVLAHDVVTPTPLKWLRRP